MNINYKQLLVVLFLNFLSINTFADSPITSTNFGKAYLNHAIVAKAAKSNSILTKSMLEYLAKESNPILRTEETMRFVLFENLRETFSRY